jgi:hypothetical protein
MCPTIGHGDCRPKPGESSSKRLVPAKAGSWEVDPLCCPRCSHEMKIISLIDEPDVIQRILRHLGLWKEPPGPRQGKTKTPEDGPVATEGFDDGWPGYEEPVFVTH